VLSFLWLLPPLTCSMGSMGPTGCRAGGRGRRGFWGRGWREWGCWCEGVGFLRARETACESSQQVLVGRPSGGQECTVSPQHPSVTHLMLSQLLGGPGSAQAQHPGGKNWHCMLGKPGGGWQSLDCSVLYWWYLGVCKERSKQSRHISRPLGGFEAMPPPCPMTDRIPTFLRQSSALLTSA
jgi:hypothetical protein